MAISSASRSRAPAAALLTWVLAGPAGAGAQGAGGGSGAEAAGGLALRIDVRDFRNDKGRVAVALFASEKDFPKQERAIAGKLAAIQGGRAVVRFEGLRPGVYAIAVLHDENSNSKMDFNFLGMPLEGYGFSNDAAATFGPPSFDDAAFKLKAPRSALSVRIRYFL